MEQQDSIPIKQENNIRKTEIVKTINSIQGRNHLKISLIREKTMKDAYQRIYEKAIFILKEINKKQSEEK